APPPTESLEVDVRRLTDESAAIDLLDRLLDAGQPVSVAAAWEGEEGRSALSGLAIADTPDTAAWLPAEVLQAAPVAHKLAILMSPNGPPLAAHRAKELSHGLSRLGIDLRSLDVD